MNDTVTHPLEEKLLTSIQGYHAMIHGTDEHGFVSVEFETLHHAATWVDTCKMELHCYLRLSRLTNKGLPFATPVVILFNIEHWETKMNEICDNLE